MMSNYRRWLVPGGTYFFTVVTKNRAEILTDDLARPILREAFTQVRKHRPFKQLAIILLPDHLHAIWSLPAGDADYETRWKRIKEEFTKQWRLQGGLESFTTPSQKYRGDRGVWQPRFWEHVIEEESELEAYFDYIHWNPVKHGLVTNVSEWPWSTFHKYQRFGHYTTGWGASEPTSYVQIHEFGEP